MALQEHPTVVDSVPGIVVDWQDGHADRVTRMVAAALAHDERTARAVVEATMSTGGLTLRGQVRTVREKEAAVAIAGAIAGVVAVIDELEIQPRAARREGPAQSFDSLLALSSRVSPLK